MNRRSSTARRRRARGAKWDPRQARLLMAGGGALLFVLISVFVWMLSGGPEPKELPAGPAPVSAAPSAGWMSASSEESVPETAKSPEEEPSLSEEPSSQPENSSSGAASSQETPGVSGEALLSAQEAPATIDLNELELPAEEEPDEPAEEPDDGEDVISSAGVQSTPKSHPEAGNEKLLVTVGGTRQRMNAYDLICRAVQNETNGLLAPEALKAHAVATYTMILYNNERGIAPAVILKTPVSPATEKAVAEVIGQAVYYNGSMPIPSITRPAAEKPPVRSRSGAERCPILSRWKALMTKRLPAIRASRRSAVKILPSVCRRFTASSWMEILPNGLPSNAMRRADMSALSKSAAIPARRAGASVPGQSPGAVCGNSFFRSESVRTALRCSTTRRGTVSCLQPMATDMAWE